METMKHQCIECKGYAANHCMTYDETTKADSEVRCVGFDPRETCETCCYHNGSHCEFYEKETEGDTVACEAWEPRIEL